MIIFVKNFTEGRTEQDNNLTDYYQITKTFTNSSKILKIIIVVNILQAEPASSSQYIAADKYIIGFFE